MTLARLVAELARVRLTAFPDSRTARLAAELVRAFRDPQPEPDIEAKALEQMAEEEAEKAAVVAPPVATRKRSPGGVRGKALVVNKPLAAAKGV